MSAPPLLSVGVPVYNGERYLAEALESALGQEYPNLEVLISDNASTDSTPDICRRFEPDSRVRYSRSPETTDAKANFGRVLGMARGEYFTWLAHDDVLTSPLYAATLVEAFEANPDAVLCASALELFRDDDPQARSVISYEHVAAGDPWPEARRALFRWPPAAWDTLVYGVFRREVLQRHFSADPYLRLPLQRLAFMGRFVIVPSDLRGYRLHHGSLARQLGTKSKLGLLIWGAKLKSDLLIAAVRSPAPLAERVSLSGVAGKNFLMDHLAWAHGVPQQTRELEHELALLAAAAEERTALIRRNGGRLPDRSTVEPIRRRSRRLEQWFRRPSEEDVDYLIELNDRVGEARLICDELLAAIEAPALDR